MPTRPLTDLFREKFPNDYLDPSWRTLKAFAKFAEAQRSLDRIQDRAEIKRLWGSIQDFHTEIITGEKPMPPKPDDVYDVRNYPPGDVPFDPHE